MKNHYSRRDILRLAAALGIAPVMPTLVGCSDSADAFGDILPEYEFDGTPGPENLFSHGVASGDPLPSAVILWTRISPDNNEPADVFWEVARDAQFTDLVGAGWTQTNAERDFTVKLDATSLAAGTSYYYRFRSLGRISPIGRTRTAPLQNVDRLRMGVVSCSNYVAGYFHAYRKISERADLDLVLHLGDYIYEYGSSSSGVRPHDPPHEIIALGDYRQRYAQYRTDPDLQEAHRQHPFVTVWDDHESANNSWRDGAENHDESEGSWAERRAAAERAYSEWLPIRDQDDGRTFRQLAFGDLVDLFMLDTRLWGRDQQIESVEDRDGLRDPSRTMLGFDQEEWLAQGLRESSARWVIAGQQVIMSPWKVVGAPESEGGGIIANTDSWDGYFAARERLVQALADADNPNFVVLTGDVHSSWAFDITTDPNDPAAYDPITGAGSVGVEFVTTSVTSTFPAAGIENLFTSQGPHLHWGETASRGYLILDLTPDRAEAAWYHFDSVSEPEATESLAKVFATVAGTNHLEEQAEPSLPPGAPADLAPG
jgi:alkaline phosphatase D